MYLDYILVILLHIEFLDETKRSIYYSSVICCHFLRNVCKELRRNKCGRITWRTTQDWRTVILKWEKSRPFRNICNRYIPRVITPVSNSTIVLQLFLKAVYVLFKCGNLPDIFIDLKFLVFCKRNVPACVQHRNSWSEKKHLEYKKREEIKNYVLNVQNIPMQQFTLQPVSLLKHLMIRKNW